MYLKVVFYIHLTADQLHLFSRVLCSVALADITVDD